MHIPVLQKEVIEYLDPKPNENFIDCTIDGGGHTAAILEKISPQGKVLGIDLDPELLKAAEIKNQKAKIKNRLILVNDNFSNLKSIVARERFRPIQGILFDLGMSSWHLEESKRGFSFQREEPLDMRYNTEFSILTAEKIVNEYSPKEIEKILKEYGEERFSGEIVNQIIKERKLKPIKTTFDLNEIIKKAVPKNYERGRIHPATRTFQALRIAVNNEIENFENALPQALEILKEGGRLAVISFHSLEDRIIKNFLKDSNQQNLIKILTKKPIKPTEQEIQTNKRSRSAKLRAAIKLCHIV